MIRRVHPHPAPDRRRGPRVRGDRGRAGGARARARRRAIRTRWSARMRELGLFGALVPARVRRARPRRHDLRARDRGALPRASCRWPASSTATPWPRSSCSTTAPTSSARASCRASPAARRAAASASPSRTRAPTCRPSARWRAGDGDRYLISGTKMFVTNGREGNTFALLALHRSRRRAAAPRHVLLHRGEGRARARGRQVHRQARLQGRGHRGAALRRLPLPGREPGRRRGGPRLQARDGRASRRAASTSRRARWAWPRPRSSEATRAAAAAGHRRARPAALADIAARVEAARLAHVLGGGHEGPRASAATSRRAWPSSTPRRRPRRWPRGAMRIAGPARPARAELAVERLYRDTPLMIIGEGTNEIQRTDHRAAASLERYGERLGALTSREGEPEERRQIVLAVRQFVDKDVMPAAQEDERARRTTRRRSWRGSPISASSARSPRPAYGGLGLDLADLPPWSSRSWRAAGPRWRPSSPPGHLGAHRRRARARTRAAAERAAAAARDDARRAAGARSRSARRGQRARATATAGSSTGAAPLVDHAAARATCFVVLARDARRRARRASWSSASAAGLERGPAPATPRRCAGSAPPTWSSTACASRATARLGDGAARRRVEVLAAPRRSPRPRWASPRPPSRRRFATRSSASTFGKPICQHQAVQLKLADMATADHRRAAARRIARPSASTPTRATTRGVRDGAARGRRDGAITSRSSRCASTAATATRASSRSSASTATPPPVVPRRRRRGADDCVARRALARVLEGRRS